MVLVTEETFFRLSFLLMYVHPWWRNLIRMVLASRVDGHGMVVEGASKKKSRVEMVEGVVAIEGGAKIHYTMTTEKEKQEPPLPPFPPTKFFGGDVRRYLSDKQKESENNDDDTVNYLPIDFDDAVLRQVMEPHICKARQGRSRALHQLHSSTAPYPCLRALQRLQFTQDEFPLRKTLQRLLQIDDLAQLHQKSTSTSKRELLQPLLLATQRDEFHQIYQRFVRDSIIPHLHKQLYQHNNKNIHNSSSTTKLLCRYQAFPCLRVVRPDEFSIGPHCDLAYGHSIASLNVYVPLSGPIRGTNALFFESSPGREDWKPMCHDDDDNYHGNGVAIIFDGVECLHFTLENTTSVTRVSLDFRVALSDVDQAEPLHTTADWQDRYSTPAGYYAFCESIWNGNDNEAVRVSQVGQVPGQVDRRVGFPFC